MPTMIDAFFSFVEPWMVFFSEDPVLLSIQAGLIVGVALLIFLVFFTAKDVVLRTSSFSMTLFSILIVALLPVVGFLMYLLIRPVSTLRERELERQIYYLYKIQRRKDKDGKKDKKASEDKE